MLKSGKPSGPTNVVFSTTGHCRVRHRDQGDYLVVGENGVGAARQTVFHVDDSIRVLIEGKPCTDSMSGEPFEATVSVTQDEKTLHGCGRALC